MPHVVVDAHDEVIARPRGGQLVQYRLGHGRSEFLGRQAVAAADHRHRATGFRQGRHDVEVERLGLGAALLGAVEHGDRPRRLGQAAKNCAAENGRKSRTTSAPTRSPRATSRSTVSRAVPPLDPIVTTTRSASGAP